MVCNPVRARVVQVDVGAGVPDTGSKNSFFGKKACRSDIRERRGPVGFVYKIQFVFHQEFYKFKSFYFCVS